MLGIRRPWRMITTSDKLTRRDAHESGGGFSLVGTLSAGAGTTSVCVKANQRYSQGKEDRRGRPVKSLHHSLVEETVLKMTEASVLNVFERDREEEEDEEDEK
ncbi:hypothetical protein PUNSTDRAFT_146545 [Punctularia strigosozonata HHB-11173 SS5]|uniref:Uncharacterized protein n=1 Tax=Punctularia strigosozonata (strain HHB-11173) TaxID=741275 RepID=R7S3D8_PUNST|nr:uncharacterized protein PUNSTDRAFT_146545 [Punctularia strigosozonata HHB-11173 SS5]EIN04307.1 hypothetical protein PUNSTDRAFT_146545 [Punctularia strigosozonata HHB-11173 SS5]